MLLSVINDVINDYYHPELIKLYRSILIELGFEENSFSNPEYIFFNYKKLDYLQFNDRNMVLVTKNQYFPTINKIIFNPIDDNEFSCNFLILNELPFYLIPNKLDKMVCYHFLSNKIFH